MSTIQANQNPGSFGSAGTTCSALNSDRVIALLLLLIAAAYAFLWARNQLFIGDPAQYMGLARSLAAGDGYTWMGAAHTKYPPGFPLLLLPFIGLWNANPALAQVVVGAFAALSLASVLFLTASYHKALAVPIGVMTVFSPVLFSLATIGVHSELPFFASAVAALGLFVSLGQGKVPPRLAIALIALLVVVASAMRTIGIALPCALAATWLHRRIRPCEQDRSLDIALVVGALAGFAYYTGWFLWSSAHHGESYFDLMLLVDPHEPDRGAATWLDLFLRVANRICEELAHYGELFFHVRWIKALWFSPITVLFGGTLVVGMWRELKGPNPVLAWYLLGYGGILALWPFNEGSRFIFPAFPILLLVSWRGVASIWQAIEKDPRKLRTAGIAAAAGGLLLFGLALAEGSLSGNASRQNYAVAAASLLGAAAGAGIVLLRPSLSAANSSIRIALWGFLALYCFAGSVQIASTAYGNVAGVARSPTPGLKAGLDWLIQNASADDVVMADSADGIYFYTGLNAYRLPKTGDRDTLLAALDQTGTTYLLALYPTDSPYYLPTEMERLSLILDERKDRMKLAYRFDAGEIYRVD